MSRGEGCWVLDALAKSGPLSVFRIAGRSGSSSATLSATVVATSSTTDIHPSDGTIDIDRRRTGGGLTISGASARRRRSALTATSPSNCGALDTAGRLIPPMPGGIALRARNSSNTEGAAMLGPPRPCGSRIDGCGCGSADAACDRRLASGAVGGASVSSLTVSGATGGDSAGSPGVDSGSDEPRSSSARAACDDAGLALLGHAEEWRAALRCSGVVDCDTSSTPGDEPDDVTPLASPPSWTGVLMKRLPCPNAQQCQAEWSTTLPSDVRAPGST